MSAAIVLTSLLNCLITVKYEARLEDGTVVSKSDGVELSVKDGLYLVFFSPCNAVFSSEMLVL